MTPKCFVAGLIAAGLLATTARGQGTLNFNNRVNVSGINAPIYDVDGVTRLAGSGFLAQLYGGPTLADLAPIGEPVPFRTGAAAGYLDTSAGAMRVIRNVTPFTGAYVQIRAWEAGAFSTWESAIAGGARAGMSEAFLLRPLGDPNSLPPTTPADMVGLTSFHLGAVSFLRQPQGGIVYAGQSFPFSVAVTGAGPMTFQWQFNGSDLAGATNEVLTLTGVLPAQSGSYTVTVRDATMTRTSLPALLNVVLVPSGATLHFSNRVPGAGIDAPVFGIDGLTKVAGVAYRAQLFAGTNAEQLAPVGEPVSFGNGMDAGYWDAGLESWRALAGVTPGDTVYVQVRVWEWQKGTTYEQARGAGSYVGLSEVLTLATGGVGDPPSPPVSLTGLRSFQLYDPPVILRPPVSQFAREGDVVTFEALASGSGPRRYQWRVNGIAIPGATKTTLVLSGVTRADAGDYSLEMSNPVGMVQSASARLSFDLAGPGGLINFNNRVTGPAINAPVFDLDGVTKLAGPNFLAQLWAGLSLDELAPVGPAVPFLTGNNAGWLDVSITGANPTGALRLIPGVNPAAGAYVQIRAWEAAGGATWESAVAAAVRTGMSAAYLQPRLGDPTTVPAESPVNMHGLRSFRLAGPPVIVQQPEDVFARQGDRVTFRVQINGTPPFGFQWLLDGNPLPGATDASLSLSPATLAAAGEYRLVVTNLLGSVTSAIARLSFDLSGAGGTVNFDNHAVGSAPIYDVDGVTELAGSAVRAQLWAGPTADRLVPVGPPLPFLTGRTAGFVDASLTDANPTGAERVVPGIRPSLGAYAQVRAWAAAGGATWEAAEAVGARRGMSETFLVRPLGDPNSVPPGVPADLAGLRSFRLRGVLFTRQPVGGAVFDGQPFALEAVAAGSAPVSYQWFRDGVELAGATETRLALAGATLAQAGSYTVRASNTDGAAESTPALLVVLAPPARASLHFSNRVPDAGLDAPVFLPNGVSRLEGAAYRAQFYAGPAPEQLAPAGEPAPFGVGAGAGYWDAGADLWREMPGVAPGGTGYVQVRAWEWAKGRSYEEALAAGGAVGASQILRVVSGGAGDPPSLPAVLIGLHSFHLSIPHAILEQPIGQTVRPADRVVFQVAAGGSLPLSYQWLLGGAPIAGATNASLVIRSAAVSDAGDYAVVIRNDVGAVTSAIGRLIVEVLSSGGTVNFNNRIPVIHLDAPVLDVDGVSRLAGEHYLVQLFSATQADGPFLAAGPPAAFGTGTRAGYWHSDNPLRLLPNVAPGDLAYLRVEVWDSAFGADYTAAAANGGKYGASEIFSVVVGGATVPPAIPADLVGLKSFVVRQAPLITLQPVGGLVYAGQAFTFEVGVASHVPVGLQWQFNGTDLPGATEPRLTLTSLMPAQSGAYRVRADSADGAAWSAPAALTVLAVPAGATLHFSNRVPGAGLDAPVFDVDGLTRLAGEAFRAQLFAGTNADELAPVGEPAPFGSGADAGYWDAGSAVWRTIAELAPGATVFVQVRVWERTKGETYEQAVAAGGRAGSSEVLVLTTGGTGEPLAPPTVLAGLQSFRMGRLPLIVAPPDPVAVGVGGRAMFTVLMASDTPAAFQWQHNGVAIPGATDSSLVIPSAASSDLGQYTVVGRNALGAVTSPAAELRFVTAGGKVYFGSRLLTEGLDAPVFNTDGSRLAGVDFRAALYAGPTPETLAPVCTNAVFGTGADAGYIVASPKVWTLANFGPGGSGFAQVRVWELAKGESFELVFARGGKVGASEVFPLQAGYADKVAALRGLRSFALQPAPRVTRQPQGGLAYRGQEVLLEAELSAATNVVSFQWQHDGVDIPGATSATLALPNLEGTNTGGYSLVVQYPLGVLRSEVGWLWVSEAPNAAAITFYNRVPAAGLDAPVLDLDGVQKVAGGNFLAQLFAGPSADALAAIDAPVPFATGVAAGYWDFGAVPWRVIPGAAAGDVVQAQVKVWEWGYGTNYEQSLAAHGRVGASPVLAVTTGGVGAPPSPPGALAGLTSIRLDRLPSILPPDFRTAYPGGSLRLEVVVTSGSPVTYAWLFGTNLIGGATNAVFTLDPVVLSDAGSYSVIVSNALGTVTNLVAQVQIGVPTGPGATVDFNNRVTGSGINAPVYDSDGVTKLAGPAYLAQLYAGPTLDQLGPVGRPMPFRTGVAAGYIDTSGGAVVNIPGVSPSQGAFLQIRVWEAAGGATWEAAVAGGAKAGACEPFFLSGLGDPNALPPTTPKDLVGLQSFQLTLPPVILAQPVSLEARTGDTVSFSVTANPTNGVTYQWERLVSENSWLAIPGATRADLTLTAMALEDMGWYRVRVSNALGVVISQSASLTVHIPGQPTIIITPGPVEFYPPPTTPEGGPGELAPGWVYAVEASSTLVDWVTVGAFTNGLPAAVLVDPGAAANTARFYRTRSVATQRLVLAPVQGFVKVGLRPGFTLVANPLLASDRTVAGLLRGAPTGTIVYKYDPQVHDYSVNSFEFGMWDFPDQTLEPGEGALVLNPTAEPVTVIFSGAVAEGSFAKTVPAGWSIQSSWTPQAGGLDTVLGLPVVDGDLIALWRPVEGGYVIRGFEGVEWSGGAAPEAQPGEAFWVRKAAPAQWLREFHVSP